MLPGLYESRAEVTIHVINRFLFLSLINHVNIEVEYVVLRKKVFSSASVVRRVLLCCTFLLRRRMIQFVTTPGNAEFI